MAMGGVAVVTAKDTITFHKDFFSLSLPPLPFAVRATKWFTFYSKDF